MVRETREMLNEVTSKKGRNHLLLGVRVGPMLEGTFRPDMEKEIKDYCREHLAIYKIPRIFAFVPQLPRTPTGKIARKELK